MTEHDDDIAAPKGIAGAFRVSQRLLDQMRAVELPTFRVSQRLLDQMRAVELPTFRVSQRLLDQMRAVELPTFRVSQEFLDQMRAVELPTFRVSQEFLDQMRAVELPTFRVSQEFLDQMRAVELPTFRVSQEFLDQMRAAAPTLAATDKILAEWQDFDPAERLVDELPGTRRVGHVNSPESASIADPPTRLEGMRQLQDSLSRATEDQRAAAKKVDEQLALDAITEVDGICWRCGNTTLTVGGVACQFCAEEIAELMMAVWSLIEEVESG